MDWLVRVGIAHIRWAPEK